MDPAIGAALVTAALAALGWVATRRATAGDRERDRLSDKRYEAYTAFQGQCHQTFEVGRRVVVAIRPPRPEDPSRLTAQLDDYRFKMQLCTEAQIKVAAIAGPRVREAVDALGGVFSAQASLISAALHLLGDPEDEGQRLEVDEAFLQVADAIEEVQAAWATLMERFAAAARHELGVA